MLYNLSDIGCKINKQMCINEGMDQPTSEATNASSHNISQEFESATPTIRPSNFHKLCHFYLRPEVLWACKCVGCFGRYCRSFICLFIGYCMLVVISWKIHKTKFGTEFQHLWSAFERSGLRVQVQGQNRHIQNLPLVIARLWFKICSPKLASDRSYFGIKYF